MAVIERVALLAKGMPALPIFTDCAGHVIGDVEDMYLHNIEDEADKAPVDNSILPGVHTAEADDEIPGVDMVQEQDVDVDLDFAPADGGNVEPPLVDVPPPVNDAPVVSEVPTDGGTRRSTRIRTQPKPYVPAFSGKMYSFATTVLGTKMLDDVAYGYNQSVAFSFMQQLLVCVCSCPPVMGGVTVKHALTSTSSPPNDIPSIPWSPVVLPLWTPWGAC
jgi:hypothetical protein